MRDQLTLGGPVDRRSALFSPCRRYRYVLNRQWGFGHGRLVVIGLNPSTADEIEDDPTIRRCMGFARRLRLDGLVMLNLFGFRATDPTVMKAEPEPVGPENNNLIWLNAALPYRTVVAAWGTHGAHQDRDREVMSLLAYANAEVLCWGTTKDGFPKHPLYLRSDTELRPYHGRIS